MNDNDMELHEFDQGDLRKIVIGEIVALAIICVGFGYILSQTSSVIVWW